LYLPNRISTRPSFGSSVKKPQQKKMPRPNISTPVRMRCAASGGGNAPSAAAWTVDTKTAAAAMNQRTTKKSATQPFSGWRSSSIEGRAFGATMDSLSRCDMRVISS
jgi:hypothetical protein